MKLARNVVAPAIVLGLCIGLAGGCGPKKPPGTNPPGETGGDGGTTTTDGGGDGGTTGTSDGGGATTDGGDAGGGDGGAAPADCGAKVADAPTLLFSDTVIFRPPPGVEFVPDENPAFIQATMAGGFMSTCDALIKRVMISRYEVDKKKKPAKVVDEMIEALASQGYAGGKKSAPVVDTATDFHLSVEYGGGGGSQAVVLYIALARRSDTDFILIYESSPEDFKVLQPTYEESAKSLFIVAQ